MHQKSVVPLLFLSVLLQTVALGAGKGGKGGGGFGGGKSGGGFGGSKAAAGRSQTNTGYNRASSNANYGASAGKSSSKWGTAGKVMAGAAAGYFAAKVGSRIAQGTSMLFWPQYGRNYWMGERYYRSPSYDMQTCHYIVDDDDADVRMEYDVGGRVKKILFECNRYRETCCGMTCCPAQSHGYHGNQNSWWPFLLGVLLLLLLAAGIAFICRKILRRRQESNAAPHFNSVPMKGPDEPETGYYPQNPPPYMPPQNYPQAYPQPNAFSQQQPFYGFQQNYPPPMAPPYHQPQPYSN